MIRKVRSKSMPHRATVVGYHGYQNLGDDIFRRLVCQWLSSSLKIDTCYISTKRGTTEYSDAQMSMIPFTLRLPLLAGFSGSTSLRRVLKVTY